MYVCKFGERAFSRAGPSFALNQTLQSFGNILKLTVFCSAFNVCEPFIH